ncbi:MAG TPA: peptidylprolyl isomerase [Steroidobacteraceae bacterium]|nr:peptidylprolyl isomerase [Steroidobacteraceae bacterium]
MSAASAAPAAPASPGVPAAGARTFRQLLAALGTAPQRSLALPACAMALGLLLAGFALFRPARRPATAVPPGYVALVNQQGVLLSDFISQTESETGTDFAHTSAAERRRVLHEMIDEELLVQRGLVLDLPETTTEVRDTMVASVNAQVDAPLLAIAPTDAELRVFYDAHRSRYTTGGTMAVQDLVLHIGGYQNADQTVAQGETDATEAVYQLRSGAGVDYAINHFGFAESGRADGSEQLDFAARIHLGPALYAAAENLGDGEVSDPIVAGDGIHVLVMVRRRPPVIADFGAARGRVYSDYRAEQDRLAQQQNLRILRSEARILLAPGESE